MTAVLGLLVAAACATTKSSPVNATSDEAKVIATGLQFGRFDLVVGQRYHVLEGLTDRGDATSLIAAREASGRDPRGQIRRFRNKKTYRHYGDDGEKAPPLCRVVDQAPVDIDSDPEAAGSNFGGTAQPVACVLPDGSTLYVTAWLP